MPSPTSNTKTIECNHIDLENEFDCQEPAEWACRCCGVVVCSKHMEGLCPFGDEPYYEINYEDN